MAQTRPCCGTPWRVHGVPCPPRDGMDVSVSCKIFWLGGGDAWREIADGMESTPVVRGSGGMPSPPEKMAALRLNPLDFANTCVQNQRLCSKLLYVDSNRHFLVKGNYDIMHPFLNSGGRGEIPECGCPPGCRQPEQ